MANITDTRTSAAAFGGRFDALRAELAARWATYKSYRSTLRELSDLSDRELADLGLSRAALRTVAYEAAYGA